MLKIIGIVASLILGAFAGRIYCNLMNRESFTIHPTLCLICGLIGGGLGSWIVSTLFGGGWKTILVEIAAGLGLACLLFVFLLFVRERKEEDEEME